MSGVPSVSCPGLEGRGEDEGAAVEDVLAALPGDQRVEGGKRTSLARQGEDVGGGAFPGPVPGGRPGQPGQAGRCAGVVPGQPLVQQAQGEPDAGGDGGGRSSGDSGWAWSKTPAASAVSPPAMAAAASRMVTAASSRACPTGVNMAMLCRSIARPSACCRVPGSEASMLLTSMPSSSQQQRADAGVCAGVQQLGQQDSGWNWICGGPAGGGRGCGGACGMAIVIQVRGSLAVRASAASRAEPPGGGIPAQRLARPGV